MAVPRPTTFLAAIAALCLAAITTPGAQLPNILWITCEDTGPQLGCYGDSYAQTPNLDRLAATGLRYKHAWSTAPVCAPARTTIITGMYPSSLGAEHMRSMVRLPSSMRMFPQFLRDRGYYCSNNSKEDYNAQKPGKVWNESSNKAHWKNRSEGQPFFAVFNLTVTHESQIRARPHTLRHDPAKARVPAYHPDTSEVRHDWAQYYDNITTMDAQAGKLLKELQDAGLAEQTIVFFFGDHGSGMPRSKRFPYNSGLQVPLIVRVPDQFRKLAPGDYAAGAATDRLAGFVDLAPTILSLAGIQPPEWMQGHAFMGPFETKPQEYLHGLRGRMDERLDLIRSVRNQRFVYIRNYMPYLPWGQHINYMFQTPTTRVWKELYDQGKLQPPQTFFWETKPSEELYDLQSDPDEVRNLAASPEFAKVLEQFRTALHEHLLRVRDAGFLPESEQHARTARSTIYELAHIPEKYPLERILAAANWASSAPHEPIAAALKFFDDSDSAVRYWAAIGCLVRGSNGVAVTAPSLRRALGDPCPAVRVVAAEALGRFGGQADLPNVLSVLQSLAPPDRNGVYVSIAVLNAINALGDRAKQLAPVLAAMPARDPSAPARAAEYVPRLVQTILGK